MAIDIRIQHLCDQWVDIVLPQKVKSIRFVSHCDFSDMNRSGKNALCLVTEILQMNQQLVSFEFDKFFFFDPAEVSHLAKTLSKMPTIYNLKFSNCFNAAFFPIENLLFSELKYRKSRI